MSSETLVKIVTPILEIEPVTFLYAYDGDTATVSVSFDPLIDKGTGVYKVRIAGVNAAEHGQPSWTVSRDLMAKLLSAGPFKLLLYGRDKYGRLIGDVPLGDGLLSQQLLKAPGVVPYSIARQLAPHVKTGPADATPAPSAPASP